MLAEYSFDELVVGAAGKNILIFTEHVNATYYISFDIPLRGLHQDGLVNFGVVSQNRMKLLAEDDIENALSYWRETLCPSLVIMTRYAQPYAERILSHFQNAGITVVYHIDDDLLEIPTSLGQKIVQQHGAPEVVAARKYLLEHCDLVYASTATLANLLKERFPTQHVIYGNIYAPYLEDMLPAITEKKRNYPIIGYMGSKGHHEDLALAVPDISRLMSEHPDLHFEVFGTIRMPDELLKFSDRVTSHSVQTDYWSFLTKLKNLQWDIGLAPLVDAPFNHCKAPTKYIEYTACRIPVAASDVSVYRSAIPPNGGILIRDGWHESLSQLLNSASARRNMLAKATNHCERTFSRRRLQQQLFNIHQLYW